MDCVNLYHNLLITYQDGVYHSPILPMNCTTKGTLVTSITCILIVLYTNVNKFSLSTGRYKILNCLLPLIKMCLFIIWRSNDKSTGLHTQRCTLIQVLPLHKVFCSLLMHICILPYNWMAEREKLVSAILVTFCCREVWLCEYHLSNQNIAFTTFSLSK